MVRCNLGDFSQSATVLSGEYRARYPAGVKNIRQRVNKGDFSIGDTLFGTVHRINGLYHSHSVVYRVPNFSLVLMHP